MVNVNPTPRRFEQLCLVAFSVAVSSLTKNLGARWPNAGLQLRRAISIQAEGIRLLESHATAPSAARLCSAASLHQWADRRHGQPVQNIRTIRSMREG